MVQTVRHPRVPWVNLTQASGGAAIRCTACGAATFARNSTEVEWFASQHAEHRSSAPTHYGAGDMIAGMTKAVGIEPCTPCEKRRHRLNGLLPRLFRRR